MRLLVLLPSAVGALLTSPASVREVFAHGEPADLAFWGGFAPRTAACQRRIGRAVARCATTAWIARRDCRAADLNGRSCDESATGRTIDLARIEATRSIAEPPCRDAEATLLGFLGIDEAHSDVSGACRDVARGVEAAVHATAPETDAGRRCVGEVAIAATRLLASTVRARTRALDRIASRLLAPSAKQALVQGSERRTDAIVTRLAQRLGRACRGASFAALYGQPPEDLLAELVRQADCLVGRTYAQAAIVCRSAPSPGAAAQVR